MHRLRAKLHEYYEHEGIRDPVRIVLKPGVYTPQFVTVDASSVGSESPETPSPALPHLRDAWKQVQHLRWPLGGLGVALAVAAIWVLPGLLRRNSLPVAAQPRLVSAPSSPGTVRLVAPRFSPESGIRILPGSDKPSTVDALGNMWLGDRYFDGGEALLTPPALLGLTSDPALFRTFRQGRFTYRIPLAPGLYELHLFFADFLGPRVDLQPKNVLNDFMVIINGTTNWPHQTHPFTYGTRPPLETEKVIKGVSPAKDGFLSLNFVPLQNFAIVNAISVLPTPDGKARPIRIVTQEKPVIDQHGQIWIPDRYFTEGNLAVHGTQVSGTSDPELFAGERHGNFQYIVPVAEGSYTVKLYFVETWFGKGAPASGGIGTRVFQVNCNGERLLNHFDILAETGVPGRLLVKTFHDIRPDEDAHIVLSFIPIENDACVNAIEIENE
jgi:hypothetical protein